MAKQAQKAARSYALPPPVGGWNARDAWANMPETDAIRLVNLFPEKGKVSIRKGYTIEDYASITNPIESFITHPTTNNNQEALIAYENTIIVYYYDTTYLGYTKQTISSGASISNNRFQSVFMNGYTMLFNGVDTPQKWNGWTSYSSSLTDAVYTGSGLTPANLIGGTTYRDRIYLIEKDTLNVWYGGSQAITGALTKFDLSYIFKHGGYIQAIDTWTHDDGGGEDDKLVVISSNGEVLVYEGDYPGGSMWRTGQYFMPKLLGRRSTLHLDGDLLLLTEQGLIAMSAIFQQGGQGVIPTLTDKIQPAFLEAVARYRDNLGWEAKVFREGGFLLINVPKATNGKAEQYVMNLQTKAWCKFTNMNATCWTVMNNKLFFADYSGVYWQAWVGTSDRSVNVFSSQDPLLIPIDLKTAFNYFGNSTLKKKFNLAQLIFSSTGDISLICDVDTDFQDDVVTSTTTNTSSEATWDVSEWDEEQWADLTGVTVWAGLSGFGRCAAIRLKGSFSKVEASLEGINVIYTPGGIF